MSEQIIDCHIHPPLEDGSSLAWFEQSRVESAERFVQYLRDAGVTQACGACCGQSVDSGPERTEQINRQMLAFRDKFPDFYIPAVQLDLRYPQESCRELEHYCRNEGVRWVGELVPYQYGGYDLYTTDGAFEIYRLAQELSVPINFHCNDLSQIERMCEAFPGCTFVLAHPTNRKDEFLRRIGLVAKYPNLYLDLSGAGLDRFGLLREAIRQAGAEKLLFGSDLPVCHPAGFIADLRAEGLSDEERRLILADNFKRLIGLT